MPVMIDATCLREANKRYGAAVHGVWLVKWVL